MPGLSSGVRGRSQPAPAARFIPAGRRTARLRRVEAAGDVTGRPVVLTADEGIERPLREASADLVGPLPDVGESEGLRRGELVCRRDVRVPPGKVVTYGRVAEEVCSAKAARATGSAVGSNPIAFLIPCHRVIRAGGITGDYAAGATRKRCMLAWEASRQSIGGQAVR
ncbi:MAG: MGMT family protein [Gemmatimonadetes bacterium]|nr:MGMT family protein [Gemmatimonadota bacterium]